MSTVLIVEDDLLFRALLARQLARRGWDVLTAGTVAGGRELLRARQCDLLLLDLGLPDGLGWQVLAAAPRRIPTIVMTCRDVSAEERQTYRPVKVLAKPLSLSELFDLLERHRDHASGEVSC